MSELRNKSTFNTEFSTKMRKRIGFRTKLALEEFSKNRWKIGHNDGFAGISMQELRKIGFRITDCKDIWEVYNILGEQSSVGPCYYDVILRPQHLRAYDKMDKLLDKLEPTRFKEGLDLGTGTGEMALVLGQRCEHLTAIDVVPSLLGVARKKLTNAKKIGKLSEFDIKTMDILDLQLPEAFVDVVIGNGLQAYLTNEEILIMMEQIRRVLKKGGRYYEYQADNPDPPEYQTSQRAFLVGELAAAVVGYTFTRQNSDSPHNQKIPGFDITSLRIIDNVASRNYREYLIKMVKN